MAFDEAETEEGDEEREYYGPHLFRDKNLLNYKWENIDKELILIWPNKNKIDKTKLWLDNYDYKLHYHIVDKRESFERLHRFFAGRPICLVFGGGAA